MRKRHMRDSQAADRLRSMSATVIVPLFLLVVAFLCGGGSLSQPLRDVIVQIAAILVLASVGLGWAGASPSPDGRLFLVPIVGLVLVVVLQLVPLPASVWTSLAGRAASAETLRLIGEPLGMRPLSLQPDRTILSGLALLPGIAMVLAAMRLGMTERLVVAGAIVLCALLSLVLGVAQVSLGTTGSSAINLYQTSHAGLPIGVFANTNHQAIFLVIAFVLAGALASRLSQSGAAPAVRWCIYAVMAAFAFGVVATESRAGIALLGVALFAIALREYLTGQARLFVLGAVGLLVVVGLLAFLNPTVARSFADFSDLDDARFRFWPNVIYAIGAMGWMGSGAGTFDNVYRSVETLDTLSSRYLNHAHNDYLEIALETGVPGIMVLLVALAVLAWRGLAIVRRTDRTDLPTGLDLAYAGMIGVGVLLLHSAADYPLRTPLLGVIFGFSCALMTRPPRRNATYEPTSPSTAPTLVRS